MNDKTDGKDDEAEPRDSLAPGPRSPLVPDNSIAGQTEISTEDTELSSADVSVDVSEASVETNVQNSPKGGVTGAVSMCGPSSAAKEQPRPLRALLPASAEARAGPEASRSFASISRSQESLKTTRIHAEPDGDDLCAAILLACLFCQPLGCLSATMRGCSECVWSLCSALCGCEPATLRPLLDVTHGCDPGGCPGVRGFPCDWPACDVCLQATECLDLAMEVSQMLYH